MASEYTVTHWGGNGITQVKWTDVTEATTCDAFIPNGLLGIMSSVQVAGTFGGGTVVMQQSNDGTNWSTIKDRSGNDVSVTAAGMAEYSVASRYVRPAVTSGASVSVDITLIMRDER